MFTHPADEMASDSQEGRLQPLEPTATTLPPMLSGITLPLLATTSPVDPSILQMLDDVSEGPVESRALAVSLAIGQMTGIPLRETRLREQPQQALRHCQRN